MNPQQESYFELGLKVLEYIFSNFPEYPPTYVDNHDELGFTIERTSNDKRKICEIMIYPYKEQVKIEFTTYSDLYVERIEEFDFHDQELKFVDQFWQFSF